MAYQNNGQKKESTYDKNLDIVTFKGAAKSDKRFLNIEVYSYNNGPIGIRIRPCEKNSNEQADANKKWINKPGISQITRDEATQLIKVLGDAINAM